MTTTWYADIELRTKEDVEPSDLEELDEAVERHYGTLAAGNHTAAMSLAFDAEDFAAAYEAAHRFIADTIAALLPEAEVTKVSVLDEDTRDRENDAEPFPPLVSTPDIAEILGVSRQMANRITRKPGFPRPILEPRTGPLWLEHAVKAWNEHTVRASGRPWGQVVASREAVGNITISKAPATSATTKKEGSTSTSSKKGSVTAKSSGKPVKIR